MVEVGLLRHLAQAGSSENLAHLVKAAVERLEGSFLIIFLSVWILLLAEFNSLSLMHFSLSGKKNCSGLVKNPTTRHEIIG